MEWDRIMWLNWHTYRMAFTSGEFSWSPLGVIWLVEIKLFWLGTLLGAGIGLKSFSIVATEAYRNVKRANNIFNIQWFNIGFMDKQFFFVCKYMKWKCRFTRFTHSRPKFQTILSLTENRMLINTKNKRPKWKNEKRRKCGSGDNTSLLGWRLAIPMCNWMNCKLIWIWTLPSAIMSLSSIEREMVRYGTAWFIIRNHTHTHIQFANE